MPSIESEDVFDPMGWFKRSIASAISPLLTVKVDEFEVPPLPELGDLALPLHAEAKRSGDTPDALSRRLADMVSSSTLDFVERVQPIGGYVNFYLKTKRVADIVWNSITKLGEKYGENPSNPFTVIVEHTSANPVHPLHIGAARNAFFGDTLARLLRARGKSVTTHFYVDDTGRQTALAALAYKLLGEPAPSGKPDFYVGVLYVFANAFVELYNAKTMLPKARSDEEVKRIQSEIDEWMAVLAEQSKKYPELFDVLSQSFASLGDPTLALNRLMAEYEEGVGPTVVLVRKLVNHCLEGFKQTLSRANVAHDRFYFESDLLWNGSVDQILEMLQDSPFIKRNGKSLVFDAETAANQLGLKELLGIPKTRVIPPLVLTRSDGTTLYTTRDLAYSVAKLSEAEYVYNIIGVEQSTPQLQLKVALYAIGYKKILNQIHVPYEHVELEGEKMTSRRGRYIALDSVLDEAYNRSLSEVKRRNVDLDDNTAKSIAEKLSVAAVRFALISVNANKKISFSWNRVLNFESNSGAYALYTYVRTKSLLVKAGDTGRLHPDFSKLDSGIEHRLIVLAARLPEVVGYAADNMRPEALTDYVLRLCDLFNSYYDSTPILGATDPAVRNARIGLVVIVNRTLLSCFSLLGIVPPERM
ncbi:MAG: arginine--tRNA ligase [Thermoprotei archaeon]